MHINCILPHYYNEKWLLPNISTLYRKRSGRHRLTLTVIDQRDVDAGESAGLKHYLDELVVDDDTYLEFSTILTPAHRGGQSLPGVLAAGMFQKVGGSVQAVESDITITIDTDTLVYPDAWDALLLELYNDNRVKVAGINPRADEGRGGPDGFNDVVEWNFMSFRTKFWHDRIRSFRPYRKDIGHRFTNAVQAAPEYRQVLLPRLCKPYKDKAATVCGLNGQAFVLHAFYASRKKRDRLPESEKQWILTEKQEDDLIERITGRRNWPVQ